MRQTSRLSTIAAVAALLLASCNAGPSREATSSKKWGETTTREIDIKGFRKINLWSGVDLVLTQGDEYRVVLEGPEKALDFYEVGFQDWSSSDGSSGTYTDELKAMTRQGISPIYNMTGIPYVTLRVQAPDVQALSILGDVNINLPGKYHVEDFSIHSGHSMWNIDIDSMVCDGEFYVNEDGRGDLNIGSLECQRLGFTNSEGHGNLNIANATCSDEAYFATYYRCNINANVKAKNVRAYVPEGFDQSPYTNDTERFPIISLNVDCDTLTASADNFGKISIAGQTRHLNPLGGNKDDIDITNLKIIENR